MKKSITLLFCICILCSCSTTRFYVVRHAEKTSNDCNSPLAQPQGFNRAEALKDSLLSKNVDSIFVSTCLRTQQTAQPLATARSITMIQFEPTPGQTQNLINRLKKIRGKNVLIVGHTNTVPSIVLELSGISITPIADTDFDNMYVVRIRRFLGINRQMVHTTYGVITN
jgi:broad specificity phosphatase PhoE